jgi:hypothetical protein
VTGQDLDTLYAQQEAFRTSERAAVDAAIAAPVEQARAELEQLAAKQEAWLDEQRDLLRDRSRQHADTGRAADQVAHAVEGRGWSL